MVTELHKGNKELVERVFSPLYELDTQGDFDKRFGRLRATFKRMYLQGRPVLSKINCGRVALQLEALKESQHWKKSIPLFRRSVAHLEVLTEEWIANDVVMYDADREMLTEINRFLNEIELTRGKNSEQAFRQLRDGLLEFEGGLQCVID